MAGRGVFLQPGESTESFSFSYFPWVAGEHRIACEVRFNGSMDDYHGLDGYGSSLETLQSLLDQVPKVDIVSNWVTVDVESDGKSLDPTYHCLMGMPKEELQKIFMNYCDESSQKDVWNLFTASILSQVHIKNNVIDGVKLTVQKNIPYDMDEDLLFWLRGSFDTIPQEIIYNDNKISEIRVGYFAEASGMDLVLYRDYR